MLGLSENTLSQEDSFRRCSKIITLDLHSQMKEVCNGEEYGKHKGSIGPGEDAVAKVLLTYITSSTSRG